LPGSPLFLSGAKRRFPVNLFQDGSLIAALHLIHKILY
jgi:hypothetical protein